MSMAMWDETHAERLDQRVINLTLLMLTVFLLWAWFFPIAEVTSGQGTVVPSSHEQVIQSLDGGVLAELLVSQGDIVEAGQILARLDPTRSVASVEEARAKYHAALARAARLRAEVTGAEGVGFPAVLDEFPDLIANEHALFQSRRQGLADAVSGLEAERALLAQEVELTAGLQQSGAASLVELIRLQRQLAQIDMEISRTRTDYMVKAQEELAAANAEAEVQGSVILGRSDQVERLVFRAPMRGIVQDVAITTIGGVVPPNGQIMTIVPLDDRLMIEARISPRDIAFIHPGQQALVKISAYDYAIFGGIEGEVRTISANTVRDEANPEVFYYRVLIETGSDALVNDAGTRFPIAPGMIATVDIQTGERTVWQYLIKPFNRAREALRER